MAGYSVLERTPVEEWSRSVADAEREHDSKIAENYQRLIRGDVKQSAPQAEPAKTEEPAERVPNAAQRLQDYVPYTLGMKKIQRIGDTPTYSSSKITDYAPVKPAASATATRAPLFEGLVYRDGELFNLNAPAVEEPVAEAVVAPAYAPSFTPEVAPSFAPSAPAQEEMSEDALPTRKTMESLNRANEAVEEKVGFFAALSTKTKVVLAVVAAVIVLMFAIVCVNTAIINSLNAGISAREAEITELTNEANEIESAISDITDSDSIAQWATEHGMELGING